MAQINLLSSDTSRPSGTGARLFWLMIMRILVVVLLAIIGLFIYLFLDSRKTTTDIQNTQKQIDQVQTELSANQDRNELITRQAQLKNLQALVNQHKYWSNSVFDLAKATLNTASYLSLNFSSDGMANLQVTVPTYEDFDRFLQVFDRPEINKLFSDVQVKGVSKTEDNNTLQLSFTIVLHYNTDSISFGQLEQNKANTTPASDSSTEPALPSGTNINPR